MRPPPPWHLLVLHLPGWLHGVPCDDHAYARNTRIKDFWQHEDLIEMNDMARADLGDIEGAPGPPTLALPTGLCGPIWHYRCKYQHYSKL